jgi:hypothetical protein
VPHRRSALCRFTGNSGEGDSCGETDSEGDFRIVADDG